MKPAVSIIVAIYNSGRWLRRCLRSALDSAFEDVEFLLIDDGSTDSSPAICDEFAALDPRIKVFHRQNAGVCATRQFGIDHAQGEYLIYLDSDDYVEPDTYGKMYRAAKEQDADLAICDWYSVYGDIMYPESLELKAWDKEHLLYALVQDQPVYQTIYLFRRSLFEELSVGFPTEKVSYGEDTLLLVNLLTSAIRKGHRLSLCHVPENLYYYDRRINPESLMKLSKANMNATRLDLWYGIGRQFESPLMKKAANNRLVDCLFTAIWNRYCTPEEFRDRYSSWLPEIRKYASAGAKKFFVCRSLQVGMDRMMKLKWLAAPVILQERRQQRSHERTALPVPKPLSEL